MTLLYSDFYDLSWYAYNDNDFSFRSIEWYPTSHGSYSGSAVSSITTTAIKNEIESIVGASYSVTVNGDYMAIGDIEFAVAYNSTEDTFALSFRGTEPDELSDYYDDALIGLGITPGDFDIVKDIANAVNNLVDTNNTANSQTTELYFTGHSLGGAYAQVAALETGNKAVTIDAPGIAEELGLAERSEWDQIINISNEWSVVSDHEATSDHVGQNITVSTTSLKDDFVNDLISHSDSDSAMLIDLVVDPNQSGWIYGSHTITSPDFLNAVGSTAVDFSTDNTSQDSGQIFFDPNFVFDENQFVGTDGSDLILGFEDDDNLDGGDGDDYIFAGSGVDILIGGEGNDLLYGGTGFDTVDYSAVDTGTGISADLTLLNPNTDAWLVQDGEGGVDDLHNIEKLIGSNYNDTFIGDGSGISFDGGAGEDTVDYGNSTEHHIRLAGNVVEFVTNFVLENINPLSATINGIEKIKGTIFDDEVETTTGGAELFLGAGSDFIGGAGDGAIIHTGEGNDQISVSNNVFITDASFTDSLINFGNTLSGSIRSADSESLFTDYDNSGVKYSVNTAGDLVAQNILGHTTFIANFDKSIGGNDHTAGIQIANLQFNAARFFLDDHNINLGDNFKTLYNVYETLLGDSYDNSIDPLVVDLDGDGVELQARTILSPHFDLTGNGFATSTGWTSGDDGFLVRDLNSNGQIDDITEMFGNATTSGFAALGALDTNADGTVDSSDTDFSDLKIWQDANRNGVVDTGELSDLSTYNITGVDVAPTSTTPVDVAGQTVTAQGTVNYGDGSTGSVADVSFKINPHDTVWNDAPSTYTTEALALPEVKGHGTIPDLRAAMSADAAFATLVDTKIINLNTPNLSVLRASALTIMDAWADVVTLPVGSPGLTARGDVAVLTETSLETGISVLDYATTAYDSIEGTYWVLGSGADILDAQSVVIDYPTFADVMAQVPTTGAWEVFDGEAIQFMERWTGVEFDLANAETGALALDAAKDVYDYLFQEWTNVAVKMAAQGPLSTNFAGLSYDVDADTFVADTTDQLVPMMDAIFNAAPTGAVAALDYLEDWKPLLDVTISNFDRGSDLVTSFGYLFQNIAAAFENTAPDFTLLQAAESFNIPTEMVFAASGDLTGSIDRDILYSGTGDQTLDGGTKGADTYIIGQNSGDTIIQDVDATLQRDLTDIVRFTQVDSSEVTATRVGNDLILDINGTTDSVTIIDQFDGRSPSLTTGYSEFAKGVSEIVFADGVVWDRIDMAWAVSAPDSASTTVTGTDQIDILNGGSGDDTLIGKDHGDVYQFGYGDGQSTIHDQSTNHLIAAPDILLFDSDVAFSDVSFSRVGNSDDLLITLNSTGDTMTIVDQFDADYTGVFGTQLYDRIEGFSFSDGRQLGSDDLYSQLLNQGTTSGDDTTYGFAWEDTFFASAGNDRLEGGAEGDDYHYGYGAGNDTIFDESFSLETNPIDTVFFASDIAPTDVSISASNEGEDIILTLNSTGETLTIDGQNKVFSTGNPPYEIEEIQFVDGTVWTPQYLRTTYLAEAGTAGNDTIHGFFTDDLIDGGAGDDYLNGGLGSDTYYFGVGSGNDTIEDYEGFISYTTQDSVDFTGTLTESDITFSKTGDNLIVTIDSTSEFLTIEDYFRGSYQQWVVEELNFTNGNTLTYGDIYTQVIGGVSITGTSAGERLDGDDGHDIILGLGGDDTIYAKDGDDILDGGDGDDVIRGDLGNDIYIASNGHDIVRESTGGGIDKIEFPPGIAIGDIAFERVFDFPYDHLVLKWGTDNEIQIFNHFSNGTSSDKHIVETLEFNDGSTYDLKASPLVQIGTAAADTIIGSNQDDFGLNPDDIISGLDGDDIITSYIGDDIIDGGAGNDDIDAGGDNDTIDAGSGDDIVEGGSGDDSVIHIIDDNIGNTDTYKGEQGVDTFVLYAMAAHLTAAFVTEILDFESYMAQQYNLNFSTGATYSFAQFGASASRFEDLELYVDGVLTDTGVNASADMFEIEMDGVLNGNVLSDNGAGIDTAFDATLDAVATTLTTANGASVTVNADGTFSYMAANGYIGTDSFTYSIQDSYGHTDTATVTVNVIAASGEYFGTTGNDTWFADTTNPIDEIAHGGLGADKLFGSTGNDTLYGDEGNDRLVGGSGNDTSYGGDGNDQLYGNDGDDTMYGGLGADTISGHTGDDTIYGGDGNDKIYGLQGNDTLHGEGGNDVIYAYYGDNTIYGGDGNDTIYSGTGTDIIDGGDGNDYFRTDGVSSDQYTATGFDNIIDYTQSMNTGIVADYVAGTVDKGNGLMDTFSGVRRIYATNYDDTVTGNDQNNYISGFNGDDVLSGAGGYDTINAGSGDDVINGGAYADTLWGGSGADAFIFDATPNSTYKDTIMDFNEAQGDTLDFSSLLTGYDPLNDILSDYLSITGSSSQTKFNVDMDGTGTGYSSETVVVINSWNSTNLILDDLINDGTVVV